MARAHDTMMNPPIEELLDRVDSKFSLVTLAARRARQINSYFNQLGDGLGHMVPPQVSSIAAQAAQHRLRGDRRRTRSSGPSSRAPRPSAARPPTGDAADRRRATDAGLTRRRSSMLAGKRIVLGVTGGIAAYKAVEVCRRLVDAGAHVVPVMTEGAEHFIGAPRSPRWPASRCRPSLWDEPTPRSRTPSSASRPTSRSSPRRRRG